MIGRHSRLCSTQQSIQRKAASLAERIPERAVERGYADHRHSLVAEEIDILPGACPEIRDMARVASDHQIGKFINHLAQHLGAAAIEREDEVLAGDAGIGSDRNKDTAETVDLAQGASDRTGEWHQYRKGFNGGYLHGLDFRSVRVDAPLA